MKLKYVITILILFICTPVYAADINTSLSGKSNIDAGEQFTIKLNVTGQNIWGLSGSIGYDTSKLTLVSSSGLSGFTSMIGTGFSLDTASGKSGTFEILSLTFKASSTFLPGESTTISFTNLTGASDSTRLSATNTQKTITVNVPKSNNSNLSNLKIDGNSVIGFSPSKLGYDLGTTEANEIQITAITQDSKATVSGTGKKTLNYGKNTFNLVVKAENGTTKTYTLTIVKKDNRSTNNYLKSLDVKSAKIKFNKYTLNYNIIVDNSVDTIDIVAQVEDSKANVTGTGKKKLNLYLNTFNVVVTAENGTKRTYRINVSRKDEKGNAGELSTNNKLQNLEVKNYTLNFNPEILKYNITVGNTVDKIELNAIPSDKNSTIKINNIEKLKVGENLITIEVLSQSGDTRTYELIVLRKDDIPIVEIKDLMNTITKTTSKQIEVEIKNDENKISSEILQILKGKNIKLTISKYENNNLRYVWELNGKNIKNGFDFDTLVKFETDNKSKIDQLTNYVQSIYLNYAYSGSLPKNTKFKVYVGDKYKDNDLLNLYYYDQKNNEMIIKQEGLLVQNGFVQYEIEHCSQYILTPAKLEHKSIEYKNIIIILEAIIIIGMLVGFLIRYKKNNKNEKK